MVAVVEIESGIENILKSAILRFVKHIFRRVGALYGELLGRRNQRKRIEKQRAAAPIPILLSQIPG